MLDSIDPESIVIVQYLDDIPFVGNDRTVLRAVTRRAADALVKEGYIISPKSEVEPTQAIGWMGKQLNLDSSCIAPSAPFLSDVVARWLKVALKPYHHKSLRRLLGKIVSMGRPAALTGSFVAGPRSWLNHGPLWSPRTPVAVIRALLEAITHSFRGWEPAPAAHSPPVAFSRMQHHTPGTSGTNDSSLASGRIRARSFVEPHFGLIPSNQWNYVEPLFSPHRSISPGLFLQRRQIGTTCLALSHPHGSIMLISSQGQPPPTVNPRHQLNLIWMCCSAAEQCTDCGDDHAPVTRGRMRAQYPLHHGPPPYGQAVDGLLDWPCFCVFVCFGEL